MLKCLVLDLDNTIWGGVVGEDGVDGIRLTPEYLDVQRAALELKERGMLLALCSKNNDTEALAALGRPDMILRLSMLADWRINWQDKAVNLREIAGYLNIGLDSIAFVDDSPTERGLVKAQLPEVTVIDLPDDPAGYAAAIRAAFPDGAVTEEDTKRSGYYSEQKRRMEAEQQAKSKEEFLHSLGLELEVGRADSETIPRIAQLSQRTNQFTLTGNKYTENQLGPMLFPSSYYLPPQPWSHGWIAYWARLKDRFGDYGIIAAAIVSRTEKQRKLEDFYLSCRAMGRGVELAFLDAIARDEYSPIHCQSEPTGRNLSAVKFFDDPLPVVCPDWIHRVLVWEVTTLPRVLSIAADVLGRPLDATASPANTPEWDSLAAINLMLALEDEFGIVFTAEEMEIAPTLGQIAEMIHAKRGACDRRPNSLP